MDEKLLSWCAGLLEGEGYVTLARRGRNSYYVLMNVANTEPDLLEPFIKLFGGRIYTEDRKDGRNMLYRWHVSGGEAIRTAEALFPYLVGKRKRELCSLVHHYAELRYRCFRCGVPLEVGTAKSYCSKSCMWRVASRRQKDPKYELPRTRLSLVFAKIAYRFYELNSGRQRAARIRASQAERPGLR